MRRLQYVLIIGSLIAGFSHAQETRQGDRLWDFETDVAGQSASGFRSAVGDWTIAMDGQNRVLAQTATNVDCTKSSMANGFSSAA